MEYITAEQFLEQDKEVQRVFLDWWEPSGGDLYSYITAIDTRENKCILDKFTINHLGVAKHKKLGYVPLLTEGQLRKFIEDKTGCKISISPSLEGKYYIGYDKYANNEDGDLCRLVYVNKILDGLWKVAIEIAKEGVASD